MRTFPLDVFNLNCAEVSTIINKHTQVHFVNYYTLHTGTIAYIVRCINFNTCVYTHTHMYAWGIEINHTYTPKLQ